MLRTTLILVAMMATMVPAQEKRTRDVIGLGGGAGGEMRQAGGGEDDHRLRQHVRRLLNTTLSAMKLLDGSPDEESLAAVRRIHDEVRELYARLERRRGNVVGQMLHEIRLVEAERRTLDKWLGKQRDDSGVTVLSSGQVKKLLQTDADVISAPRLLTSDGQTAVIQVGDAREVEYLERQEDGSYRMTSDHVRDGVTINVTADRRGAKSVHYRLQLEIAEIVGKTAVESGAKTIGKPIVSTRSIETEVVIPKDETAAIRVRGGESHRDLAILIRVADAGMKGKAK